jgi:hypothetical protein
MLNVETEYYTLEMHLKTFQELPDYSAIYNNWCLDKKEISKALSAIPHFYPHFSDHDESHSQKIVRNIEMLLGTERIKALGPTTTWIILMVSYLHDTGMILVDKILSQEWSKKEFQNYISELRNASYDKYDEDYIQAANYILDMNSEHTEDPTWPLKVRQSVILLASEYFRRSHPTYSRDALDKLEEYGLSISAFRTVPVRLKYMIGQISYLHGQPFEDVMKLEYEANGVGIDKIHPRFIAELLRIGDLLDLDDGRFNQVYQKMISSMPVMSATHKQKHASIRHFLINPKVIEITADCESPGVYRATQSWVDWIEDELKNFSINWSQVVPQNFPGGPPRLGETKLFLKGKTDLSQQANLRFEIKQENAFDIIEGSGIYDSKLVFLRELLQNAIDATKIQIWIDLEAGRFDAQLEENGFSSYAEIKYITDVPLVVWDSYTIDISVNLIEKYKIKIVVADRGCGIGINDLQRLSNVGQSWRSSKAKWTLIQSMPDWLKPTGTFGIGLQSVFLATEEAIIYTKADGETGKKATLVSRKKNGYITVEEEEHLKLRGTKIELDLNLDLMKDGIYTNNIYTNDFFTKDLNLPQRIFDHLSGIMKNYLRNSFFVVRMILDKELINIAKKYDFIQHNLLKDFNDEEEFIYKISFDKKTGNILFNLLDKVSGSWFELLGNKRLYGSPSRGIYSILFKGIEVKDTDKIRINSSYFEIEIDLLSDQTKKYLNIARSTIKADFRNNIKETISDYQDIATRLICEYLNENQDEYINFSKQVLEKSNILNNKFNKKEIQSLIPISNLILACLELNLKVDIALIKAFLPNVLRILLFDNTVSLISPMNIFENEYIVSVFISRHQIDIQDVEVLREMIENILKNNKVLKEFIGSLNVVVDKADSETLYLKAQFQRVEELKIENLLFVKLKRKNINFNVSAYTLKEKTDKYFYELSRYNIPSRKIFLPLEKYKTLIVNKLPENRTVKFSSMYIISPFLFNEIKEEEVVNTNFIELYKWVEEKMGLNELIDWVEKYSVHDPVPTKKKIRESYKELIKDYCEIRKNLDFKNPD